MAFLLRLTALWVDLSYTTSRDTILPPPLPTLDWYKKWYGISRSFWASKHHPHKQAATATTKHREKKGAVTLVKVVPTLSALAYKQASMRLKSFS